MSAPEEKKGPTLADVRKARVASMACGAEGPPIDGNPGPACQRPRGHDGPHRTLRARDFATTAEWFADQYFVKPPARKK